MAILATCQQLHNGHISIVPTLVGVGESYKSGVSAVTEDRYH